jgi:hypothetical protein
VVSVSLGLMSFLRDSSQLPACTCQRSILVSDEPSLPKLGGSRQPPDRQLRYYRQSCPLASGEKLSESGTGVTQYRAEKHCSNIEMQPKHETPLTIGVAFHVPALVTGLPANHGRWLYPPRLSQAISAGLPLLWRLALAERLLFLRAGRDFPSSRYITGTPYIAI